MGGFATLNVTWQAMGGDILKLGLAYVLALPIGWDRERENHTAGLRTFPIVSIAACGFAMMGIAIPNAGPDSYSRILQGLITGIGFVGRRGHSARQGRSHRHGDGGQHLEHRHRWRGGRV
ncbi:MAG: MgtC/SapB family protein [Acidobacteriota bacterium]